MKKLSLIFLAAIVAFIITEFVLSKVIGPYPVPGSAGKRTGYKGDGEASYICYPHSKYWTVEGGNKIFQLNNIGLPGIDIVVSPFSKYIYVLGSSYIEASQVPPEKMATSVLQILLNQENPEYQVINLGASAHDPYDMFFRLAYYERKYRSTKVVLVLEELFSEWLKRHHKPLIFNISNEMGKVYKNKNPIKNFAIIIIRKTAFLSLVWDKFKGSLIKEIKNDLLKKNINDKSQNDQKIPEELKTCLIEYKSKYKDKFILVSIINNNIENNLLAIYCKKNCIKFISSDLNSSNYKINKKGHLNIEGNYALGRFIYENI